MKQRPLEWELGLKKQEQEIDELEDKFREQREELQRKKAEVEWKKRNDWEWQQRQMEERAGELEKQREEDERLIEEAKRHLIELRKRDHAMLQEELKVEEKIVEAKQLQRMEAIVRKKLELEKLHKQREDLRLREVREQAQLEAILQEKERRDIRNLNNLNRIITHAQHIDEALQNGDLDRKNQLLLASALAEGGDANDKQRKKMIDEILAKRDRDRNQRILGKEARLRELNDQRFQLITKEETVRKRREIHDRLVDRGIDFLVELELGKAPPRKLLEQNLDLPAHLSLRDRPLATIITDTKRNVHSLPSYIEELRRDQDRTHGQYLLLTRQYKGEVDIRTERPDVDPVLYAAMRGVVFEVVEEAFRKYDAMMEELRDVQSHREYYLRKNEVLRDRLEWFAEGQARRAATNGLVEDVIEEMSYACAKAMLDICAFSQNSILTIVAAGIKAQRGGSTPEDDIKKQLAGLLQQFDEETRTLQHVTVPRS